MAISSQQYCLRWNNHRANLLNVFDELLHNEAFTDVTIAAEGGNIKCHKVVLVACSAYFQSLFAELQRGHPIVVLKDVKLSEIKAILEYMYRGEVNVAQNQLGDLLKVAEMLKVKGLVDENAGGSQSAEHRHEEAVTSMSPPPAISTSTGGASHNIHGSPPHSTGSPYGGLYGGSKSSSSSSSTTERNRLGLPWSGMMYPASNSTNPYPHQYVGVQECNVRGIDIGFKSLPMKRKRRDGAAVSTHQQSNLLTARHDMPILRTALDQGHVDSSHVDNHHEEHFRGNSTSSTNDDKCGIVHTERAHSPYADAPAMEEDEKQRVSPQPYATDSKSGIVNFTHQRPEWKRYKQYSRDDIMRAIDAVKAGISPVQAARTHGVPSRTLYDKVKKLGISTPRPFKRAPNGSGNCFPFPIAIGSNMKGSMYSGSLNETDNESRDTNSAGALENTTSSSFETTKTKDTSQDRGESAATPMDAVSQCSTSPVIRCVKQEADDEVEDLSLSRKSDVPVIMPPTTSGVVHEESQDRVTPNDRQDYN